MREAIKKVLLAFFAASLAVPAVLLPLPQKTDALVGCLIGGLVNKGIGLVQDTGKDIADTFTAVSTHDTLLTSAARQTRDDTSTLKLKECTLDGFVTLLGQTMIQTFTKGIVDWINRGFEGEPAFVTNPEGFAGEVADRVVGQEIKAVAPFLCQPFRLQLQLALGLQYGFSRQREIGCTLSNVIANMQGSYQGFVGGDFRQGGWQNWLAIAGNNQNNAYGAYFATTDSLNASIVTATGEQIKLLDWGKGFKSWRKCLEHEQLYNHETEAVTDGKCIKEGPIQTPGSVIVDQTNGALKAQLDRFQVADEVDEILGALTNQLLSRAMGGLGGLVGSSKADNNGVRYIDTLVTDLDKAQQATDAPVRAPAGIDCNLQAFYIQGTGDKVMIRYDYDAKKPSDTATQALDYTQAGHPPILLPAGQKWSDYFTQISRGCANVVDRFIADRTDSVAKTIIAERGGAGGDTAPQQTIEGNLSRGKQAEQSSFIIDSDSWRFYVPEAENAVNGGKDGDNRYGLAVTGFGATEWWQVDLAKDEGANIVGWNIEEISGIRIYGPASIPVGNSSVPSCVLSADKISILDKNKSSLSSSPKPETEPTRSNLRYNVSFPTPIVGGRYVKITGTGCNIALAEVEIYGKQTQIGTAGAGATTPTATALSVAIVPADSNPYFKTPPPLNQDPRAGDIITKKIMLLPSRSTNPGETVAVSVQFHLQNKLAGDSFSLIFTNFFAELARTGEYSKSPSFVSQDDGIGIMDKALVNINDPLTIWDTAANKVAMDYPKIHEINRINMGSPIVNQGVPVYIAAGLSLQKDKPLEITFTGKLAESVSGIYELIVKVYRETAGTDGKQYQLLADSPVLVISPAH